MNPSPNRRNRIDAAFARLKAKGQKAFIPYLVAGVPGREETVELALELERLGADILELGYPFSDPIADGVVNQAAANRALELGVDANAYFAMAKAIRAKSDMGMVAFTYLNPLVRMGLDRFVGRAADAGMDGILVVDLPVEEADDILRLCRARNLDFTFLVAPTTTPARLERILKEASGFIYYVSRTGVTGERDAFQDAFEDKVARVKAASGLPVAVGFGIHTPEHVRTVCGLADGAIVGTALVRRTLEAVPFDRMKAALAEYARPLIAPTKENWGNGG